jgi:hypothetical protein
LRRELDLRPREDELRREREVLRCELRADALRRFLLCDELLFREVERCLVAMS